MDVRRVLARPAAYDAFQSLMGAERARRILVGRYLKPREGERVLDIGCGTGEILNEFPQVDYVGVDVSEAYISKARERYGARGRFAVGDAAGVAMDAAPFDLVCAIGVIHHVPDREARRIFRIAKEVLAPGGRIVTSDPVLFPGQHWLARGLARLDRGQFVRNAESYLELAQSAGLQVHSEVWQDVYRVPYSAFVMRCSGAPESAQ